jgi:outer membrane protein TolC
VAQRQLQLGSVGYLALVISEQAYQQAVVTVAQARASRFADTAALFQALGGTISPVAGAPSMGGPTPVDQTAAAAPIADAR